MENKVLIQIVSTKFQTLRNTQSSHQIFSNFNFNFYFYFFQFLGLLGLLVLAEVVFGIFVLVERGKMKVIKNSHDRDFYAIISTLCIGFGLVKV